MSDLRDLATPATYPGKARQTSKAPARTAKAGVGATTLAGPVSPSLLRQARAILWADERPSLLRVEVGARLVSEANARGSWHAGASRAKNHRAMAFRAMAGTNLAPVGAGPLVIVLTRIGPRRLDDDNAARSIKAVRDGVADALGLDDGHESLTWLVQQERGAYGARIEIWRWEP